MMSQKQLGYGSGNCWWLPQQTSTNSSAYILQHFNGVGACSNAAQNPCLRNGTGDGKIIDYIQKCGVLELCCTEAMVAGWNMGSDKYSLLLGPCTI